MTVTSIRSTADEDASACCCRGNRPILQLEWPEQISSAINFKFCLRYSNKGKTILLRAVWIFGELVGCLSGLAVRHRIVHGFLNGVHLRIIELELHKAKSELS